MPLSVVCCLTSNLAMARGLENAAQSHDIGETMSAIGSIDSGGDLAVFAAVVASGGFAAAARALALTPSAVSKRVRDWRTGWASACSSAPRGKST